MSIMANMVMSFVLVQNQGQQAHIMAICIGFLVLPIVCSLGVAAVRVRMAVSRARMRITTPRTRMRTTGRVWPSAASSSKRRA